MLRRIFKYHRYTRPAAGWRGYVSILGKPLAWVGTDGAVSFSWQIK